MMNRRRLLHCLLWITAIPGAPMSQAAIIADVQLPAPTQIAVPTIVGFRSANFGTADGDSLVLNFIDGKHVDFPSGFFFSAEINDPLGQFVLLQQSSIELFDGSGNLLGQGSQINGGSSSLYDPVSSVLGPVFSVHSVVIRNVFTTDAPDISQLSTTRAAFIAGDEVVGQWPAVPEPSALAGMFGLAAVFFARGRGIRRRQAAG